MEALPLAAPVAAPAPVAAAPAAAPVAPKADPVFPHAGSKPLTENKVDFPAAPVAAGAAGAAVAPSKVVPVEAIPPPAKPPTIVTPSAELKKRDLMNIYLINTPRYHFEVVLPFLRAFSSLPDVNVTLWAGAEGSSRFGVGPMLEAEARPYPLQMEYSSNLTESSGDPDFIFLTSCPEDIAAVNSSLTAFLQRGAHVQCIVHEASKWDLRDPNTPYRDAINYMVPWIRKGQWEIVTLSPHVSNYVGEKFPWFFNTGMDVIYRAKVLHPVFKISDEVVVNEKDPFAAIPGKYEPWRRNYKKIFEQYIQYKPNGKLHLLGSGKKSLLQVPPEIEKQIVFERGLTFPLYFNHIAQSITIIPTFATPEYTLNQASSSVATAIIASTPLLVDRKILKAYSQFDESTVWLQQDDESEIQAFSRISFLGPKAWMEKKRNVERLRERMMDENCQYFETVLQSIWARRHN
ncbi:uncharacterized protein V1510DRAFT_418228 [Dipodascopsis tothii]|uniref:uncharacterized protein n=1 Tax=Dipodascopsis tothii TaxID=44089 RepID=UPI0034CED090